MNTRRAWLGAYRLLVLLYPPRFRAEFGEELLSVFAEKLAGAGRSAPLVFWHELVDLPFNLMREYSHHLELNHRFEKILTHQEYSRRRQAASLGFALCFACLELVNGLSQIARNNPLPYHNWAETLMPAVTNLPHGIFTSMRFSLAVLAGLALGGLIAGLVIGWAEKPPRLLRFGLAGAISLPAAYAVLVTLSALVAAGLAGSNPIISMAVQGFFNIFAVPLFAGLAAGLFGLLAMPGRSHWLRLPLAGMCGFILGVLAGILVAFALNLSWSLIAALLALANHTDSAAFYGMGTEWVLSLPVMATIGEVFGIWIGNELDHSDVRMSPSGKMVLNNDFTH